MNKKILVCGGRDYNNRSMVFKTLDKICYERDWITEKDEHGNYLPNVIIVNGAAKGADYWSTEWAVVNWTRLKEYPANWQLYGRAAGHIRNKEMLLECPDLVVAFPGGKGTANMVKIAKKAGIEVIEINE